VTSCVARGADHWGGCLRHHLGAGRRLGRQHRRDHRGVGHQDRQSRRDDRDHRDADHPWADDQDHRDHPGAGHQDRQSHRDDRGRRDEHRGHRDELQDHRDDRQSHLYERRGHRGHWGERHWDGYCPAAAEWGDPKPTTAVRWGVAEWDDRLPTSARGDVAAESNLVHLVHWGRQVHLAGVEPAAGPQPDARPG